MTDPPKDENKGESREEFRRMQEEHEKVIRKLTRQNETITSLLEGTKLVLENKNFTETAKKIFNHCAKLIGARAGYVALLTGDGTENELLFLESGGLPCDVDESLPMPVRGLRKVAYDKKETVYDNRYRESEHNRFMPEGHTPLNNVMFAPLVHEGKAIGLLGLAEKDGGFTDEDARLATSFAEYVTLAMVNTRNREALEEINATRDRMLSIIAHDLRNPFNVIMGFTELLQKVAGEMDREKIQKYSGQIYAAGKNTYNLLENLLQWVRSDTLGFNPKKTDLTAIVRESINDARFLAQFKNIRVISGIPEGICVYADQNMIRTIVRNLVSNAIKFTAEGGEIRVWEETGKDHATIIVEDNGEGMDRETLEKLFDEIRTVSSGGTAEEKGSGLGLLLCKEFAEKHGGSIRAESEKGRGSRFMVNIPVKK